MSRDWWPRCFQSTEDRHQHFLSEHAALGAVAEVVFEHDDGRSDFPLRMIVVEGNIELIQKRQQFAAMPPEPFDQTATVFVLPLGGDQPVEPGVQTIPARGERRGGQLPVRLAETDRIADLSLPLLAKRRPLIAGRFVLLGVFEFAQQMRQALLRSTTRDRVVDPSKVGHQRAVELFGEELLQRHPPRAVCLER